jgi:hypothetical protein
MPHKVRIISQRNPSFDHYIADIIDKGDWETEHVYFGIPDEERARFVRAKLYTAGKHMNPPVAVKVFWTECTKCEYGEPGCQYHVKFSVFDMNKAREYRKRQAAFSSGKPQ